MNLARIGYHDSTRRFFREGAQRCLSHGVSLASECVVTERYRDSEAAIEHAEHVGHISAAILTIVSVVHGEVLGEPSAELRANLAHSEVPQLFTPYDSMEHHADLHGRGPEGASLDVSLRPSRPPRRDGVGSDPHVNG